VQRERIVDALADTGGLIEGPAGAAARLGINPSTLRSRMKKLKIGRGTARAASARAETGPPRP
jgi:transcriptional regulator with GAF, ATPase, and Fis domain